jgi:capsular exopolysaccharide synthesis family protein
LGVALAIVLGAGIGVGLALLLETLDDGVRNPADAELKLGVPAIASIPLVSEKALRLLEPSDRHPAGMAAAKPMSGFAEAFRVLKTAIAYSSVDRDNRVIAVASALPGEGKTTCSLSLARIASMSGLRVLLVDCDLRRHSLNELLNIAPQQGLLQVLAGEADWRQVIGQDEVSGVNVLPAAASTFTPRDVFGSAAMQRLLDEVRPIFDLVILDCAPVLAVADTRVIAAQADGVVVIARWGKTSIRAIADGLDQLESTGAKVIGLAINCVDPRVPGRGSYGDALYYESARQGYYSN